MILLGCALAAGPARAAEIKGSASDASGGALAGARILLENLATGAEATTTTDASGGYAFGGLAVGIYRVSAQVQGFSTGARNVSLATDREAVGVDFVLSLGNLQSLVTVTASRSARDALLVPLRVERLGLERLTSANPTSTGDLIQEAPGVTPVANGPFQVRPRLRGLDSTRVLILVDGERLNNARTATDRAGVEVGLVDPASIESVEVVSGSGSVLYGTDALSGTINIITAQPRFADETRFTANASGYYSTNDKGRRGSVGVGVAGPRFAIGVGGSKEKFDDYRSGGSDGVLLEDSRPLFADGTLRQQDTIDSFFPPFTFKAFPDPFNAPFTRTTTRIPTSGFEGEAVNANALVGLSARQTLRLKYFHRKAEDVGFPDFTPPQFFQGIVLPVSKIDKVSAKYQARQLRSWWASLAVTAYFQKQDRLLRNKAIPVQFPAPTPVTLFPINVFRLVIDSDTEQRVKTGGVDVQGTFLVSPRNVLTAGFTLYRDDSSDRRTSSTQLNLLGQVALGARGPAPVVFPAPLPLGPPSVTRPVRVPDATFRDLGVFAQDEWDVTPRLRLVGALRLDSYRVASGATPGYDIQGVIAGAQPAISPATLPSPSGDTIGRTPVTGDLGAVYKASDELSLSAHYGRSYRHPNLEELLFAGPATIGSIAPNVTVGPEKGGNLDLGVKFRSGRLAGGLSLFRNDYKGFISTEITALTPGGSVSQAVNFADVRIEGIEADFEAPIQAGAGVVTLFANGAYNRGEVRRGRNPLTGASVAGTPQDNITPFKAVGGLRVSDRKNRFWAEWSFRHQKRIDRVAVTLSESPFLIFQDLASLGGFTIQRLGAGYDWTQGRRSIGLTLHLENLGNTFYREQFQFAPARGRSVTFGVRIKSL